MKKIMFALSVAAISALGFNVNAQQPEGAPVPPPCPNGQECQQTPPPCQQGQQCQQTPPAAPNPFEGIELTTEQQAKIDALQKAAAESRKEVADSAMAARKVERQERMAQERQNRVEYLNALKGILTTDQYTQFLENYYLNGAPQGPQMLQGPRGGKRGEGFQNGAKRRMGNFKKNFQRGDKPAPAENAAE